KWPSIKTQRSFAWRRPASVSTISAQHNQPHTIHRQAAAAVSTRFAPPDRRGVGVWDAAALTCYRVGWVINQTEKKHPLHRVMSEVQRRYIGDEGTPPAKQHV